MKKTCLVAAILKLTLKSHLQCSKVLSYQSRSLYTDPKPSNERNMPCSRHFKIDLKVTFTMFQDLIIPIYSLYTDPKPSNEKNMPCSRHFKIDLKVTFAMFQDLIIPI